MNQAQPAAPPPPPRATAPGGAGSLIGALSQGEQLVGLGALIILVADLVFDLFGPYSGSYVIWAAAAMALLAILLHRFGGQALPVPYEPALIVAGALAAFVEIRNAAGDVIAIIAPSSSFS